MRILSAFLLAAALAVPAAAHANPLKSTISAKGSGDFNGVAFTNQQIVLTFFADTSNIVNLYPFGIYVDGASATIAVGSTIYTVTDPLRLFTEPFETDGTTVGLASIGDLANGETTIPFFNSAFQTYDLTTSFGPITGDYFENETGTINVVGGVLSVDASTFTDRTFQVQVTPEPSSLIFLGSGVVGMAGVARRRFLKA